MTATPTRKRKPSPDAELKRLLAENADLRTIVGDLHWMARRYADSRRSYAAPLFNHATRTLLRLGVKLDPTTDGIVWARDGLGRGFDGLSDAEATPGTPEARGEHTQPSKETR